MKIPLDPKFIKTTICTFIPIIVVVVILNKIAGAAAATVTGTVLGGIVLRLFDKLDYSPTSHIDVSAKLSKILTVLSGIFILYGCTIFVEVSKDLFKIIYGKDYLFHPIAVLVVIFFDWSGFILGGWLIGRLFSNNAMRITTIAGFFLVVAHTLNVATGEHSEKFRQIILYLSKLDIFKDASVQENMENAIFGMKAGGFIGGILRAYIAIVSARISSRRCLNKSNETA